MQEMWELSSNVDPANRRYTVHPHHQSMNPGTEDLHAWSIYRQNLNSDFTDSALGSEERSPLPYGNFQLREQTVQSILRHPRLAPRSELANNMYAYLKFGLPRVFPPGGGPALNGPPGPHGGVINKGFKDTASDIHMLDSASSRNAMGAVSRARSETDLVNGGGQGHSAGGHHPMGLISNRFRKPNMNKAISESNLLNGGDHPPRPMSKAGSQASLVSRNSRHPQHHGNHLGNSNRVYVEDGEDNNYFEFPHLQVRGLGYETKSKARILDGISFDLHGGESLAILSTNGLEATTMLDILAGRTGGHGKVYGEFTLNGNPVTIDRLGSRVGYVRKDYRLHTTISVEQTLAFHYLLRSKDLSTKYLDTKISVLLEELGLGSVRKSLVSTLTSSERQRLVVACQLITGAEILCLDDATHGMDIFDTFFLVEYLRQWSTSDTGRIVLMTIHPPTYEIFSMFSKVALVSTGRLMFYGHRREMLPYFAFIEYPCPAFKNPSDYYLDLVTLDNLSSEALLESSQRIETLADSFRRKQEMIADPVGPPQPLPPRIKNAGFLRQFYALFLSWIAYKFPWNIVDWMLMLLVATSMSIFVGALYWNIRLTHLKDQNNASDRMGFHWVLMCLLVSPVMIMVSSTDTKDLDFVTRDFEEKLYSKAVYFIAKNLVELPYMLSIYLGYVIPAYAMAGLSSVDDKSTENFYVFIGYMLLYMHVLRIVLQGLTYLFRNSNAALTTFAVLFLLASMGASYTIHPNDLGEWIDWMRFVSPVSWVYKKVIQDEMNSVEVFSCPRYPVMQDTQIVTQLDCRINNGPRALDYFGLASTTPQLVHILSVLAVGFIFYLIGFFSFILRRQGVAVPPIEGP